MMETYNGHVRTPADAIILFEACRLGLLPRVQRRLSEKERQSIKSGSVFVWDEREAGMRRWTDGKSWSASRVSGSFLTYREMEGKRSGNGFTPAIAGSKGPKTPDSVRGSEPEEVASEDGPDGYRYKPDGLMKQSFSITTSQNNHLHLISYYSRTHSNGPGLNNPSNDPQLRNIRPTKGMYPESTVQEQQNIPPVTRAPMLGTPYSAVPQAAGYARGPPHPPHPLSYSQQSAYGWPSPPPQSMIPGHNGYGYQYNSPATLPPPSSMNGNGHGHSPLSYVQSAPHQSSQHQVPLGYDRPPPPHSENLQTTPHLIHHRSSSSGSSVHQQAANSSSHGVHSGLGSQQQGPHQRHPSSTPPLSKIDPRLMAPSSLSHNRSDARHSSRTPIPPRHESSDGSRVRENGSTPVGTINGSNGPLPASSIPSIGALINGSSADNSDARSESSNRSASRSPGGTKKNAKDIPSDKLGFGEDMRTLKMLDKAFNVKT